jgi:hypothetical protein
MPSRGVLAGKNGRRAANLTNLVDGQRGQQNSRGWTVIDPKKFRLFSLPVPNEESKPQSADVIEIFLVNWRLPPGMGRVRWIPRRYFEKMAYLPLLPIPTY